jgi:ABC-type sulfate transport system substrate-binding protein
MLIPTWTTHPVADAVLFVNVKNYPKPQIIFVQVSTSSYTDHRSKIPNLHPIVRQHWKLSILQSYQIVFGITDNVDTPNCGIAKGKLPQNVKYVYATTNETLLGKSSQYSGHSVFLMRKENIKNLNEQL